MTRLADPYQAGAVRGSLAAFLVGRGVSAVLTFTAFALAARVLSLDQYGVYVTALATLETGLALATAGLDWVAVRLLPEYRLHGGGRATARAIGWLTGAQVLLYAAVAACGYAGAAYWERLLRIEAAEAVLPWLAVLLVVEGAARIFRDQMLGALMRQGVGQFGQSLRSGLLVVWLGTDWLAPRTITAPEMLRYELLAAAAAAVAGGVLLVQELWRLRHLPPAPRWVAPKARRLFALAIHMYFNHVLALVYGANVLTLLVARMLGAEAVALFGFGNGFAQQVRRYLPTELLQSVIRPSLFAFFSRTRDFSALMIRLGLWLKSSLVMLVPIVVYFVAFGERAAGALGGQQFREAWPVVAVLLLGAGASALRRIVELASNAVMASALCVEAGVWLLAVPLLTILILVEGGRLLPVVALTVIAEVFYGWRVIAGLRRRGYVFPLGLGGVARLLAWSGCASLALRWTAEDLPLDGAASLALCLTVSGIAIFAARPLTAAESELAAGWGVNGVRQVTRLLAR
jgi:O-antigen/teichoic acid export membrane protein